MSVLTLADAKLFLNLTDSTQDTELQTMIDAAEAVIAKHIGPLASTATTSRVRGGTDALILPILPAISLTSITPVYPGQPAIDLTNVTLNPSGVVTYQGFTGYFGFWAYDVVYQAGRAFVPGDLLMAIKQLLRHFWSTQRGAGAGGRIGSDSAPSPSWMLPNAVRELIDPYIQAGFA